MSNVNNLSIKFLAFDWPLQRPFLRATRQRAWVNAVSQLDFVRHLWHLLYLSNFPDCINLLQRNPCWVCWVGFDAHFKFFFFFFFAVTFTIPILFLDLNQDFEPRCWIRFLGKVFARAAGAQLCSEADETEVKAAGSLAAAHWQTNLRIRVNIWSPCTFTPYCLAPFFSL